MSAESESRVARPDEYVRDVLTRLSQDLDSGLLSLRVSEDGTRYVVDDPAQPGSRIVVPCADGALVPPPRLPPRQGLVHTFSPFTIGRGVRVPWSAIAHMPGRGQTVCFRPSEVERCSTLPPPECVIVLRVRGCGGDRFAWFVRYANAGMQLTRLAEPVAVEFLAPGRVDGELAVLVDKFYDSHLTDQDDIGCKFESVAAARFSRHYRRAAAEAGGGVCKRKRESPVPASSTVPFSPPVAAIQPTCVVCLDEKPTASARCRHATCAAHVCDVCHADSRGLCPICDRSSINAVYPCACCRRLTKLSDYGFPCVACSTSTLCTACYKQYGECSACECE